MASLWSFSIPTNAIPIGAGVLRLSRKACSRFICSSSRATSSLVQHHNNSFLKSTSPRHVVLPCEDDYQHCGQRIEELQERTSKALRRGVDDHPTTKMKLIDTLQRLGIAYHFEEDMNVSLQKLSDWKANGEDDLYATALRFRLVRHNGWPVCSDIFKVFMDETGEFKESLRDDMWGMLSLYEASYLGAEGEDILTQAMKFTTTHLRQSMPRMTPQFSRSIAQALELPRHFRMSRLETRNYIDEYSSESNPNMALLELAKLDFNMVQSIHQTELAEITRWWKELGLVDKLSFARDRPLECYLWTVGIFPEPCHSSCRIELAKTIAILLVIDDIFDSYGSFSDLVLFTNAIKRWDLCAMEHLPQYMKICYMALYNTTNDIGYRVLKEHGCSIVPHLKRTWIDMFEAFLVEAEWCNSGYVPTVEEYLANGVTTAGTYMALVHSFFLMGHGVTEETIKMMEPYPKLFSGTGRILRLWDDLGTAKEEQERGDVASSIECYMRESNISSNGEARKHIRQLIHGLWKEINGELLAPEALPLPMIRASLNLSRTAQVIFQHGDDNKGFSVDHHVQSLFFRPIIS
ncbi:probable terpene synthase 11 [Cornus florida]|uniref:probable terpene synthase 11 n=1 Tax=Cornus florida TaxID=4283 RepID=UPI0028A12C8D|nr:probable terpene synthase 11 [Cornus florida]